MMHTWFETKVRYERTFESGLVKKVTEPYLVDAISFTEAEARIIKEMQPFISGEFEVRAIKRANYSELIPANSSICQVDKEAKTLFDCKNNSTQQSEADRYYRAKIAFITLDEKTGEEKKVVTNMLVHANSVNSAHDTIREHMRGTMADYDIVSVSETGIMDVFVFNLEEQ
jgi:hypothetical protein